jgi:hypothetical protein
VPRDDINLFVWFLAQNQFTSYLPSSYHTVKLPNGQSIELPRVLRQVRDVHIIKAYSAYLQQTGQEFRKRSIATLKRILQYCPADHRRSPVCADYFVVDGMDVSFKIEAR